MLVITISMITAAVRYDRNIILVSFQYLYSQLAVSSLPTSNVPAITAILMGIPLNSSIKPTMENHAATPAIAKAVNNVNKPNNIHIFIG